MADARQRNTPPARELRELGTALAKTWPGAKTKLRVYLDGFSPWGDAVRPVKLLCREVNNDIKRGAKVPLSLRDKVLKFAVTYGTEVRNMKGGEPLDARTNVRFSTTDLGYIIEAAERAGVTVADYIRAAAVSRARQNEAA